MEYSSTVHENARKQTIVNDHNQSSDSCDNGSAHDSTKHSITSMLDDVEQIGRKNEQVSFGEALDAAGHHSYAPMLLMVGLIMAVPGPADIPGVPSILGILVIIIAVQVLMSHEHVWVPSWLERRRISSKSLDKMISWCRRPATWLDRWTKPRFEWLLNHAGTSVIAVACIMIGASTPLLEFIPMSANIAGVAIAAFGLAVFARDGVVAMIAILFSLSAVVLVATQMFG